VKLDLSISEGKAEIIDLDDKCRKICEVDEFSIYEVKYMIVCTNKYDKLFSENYDLKEENEKLKEDNKLIDSSLCTFQTIALQLQQQLDKAAEMLREAEDVLIEEDSLICDSTEMHTCNMCKIIPKIQQFLKEVKEG
jgi:hypothetical protein